MNDKAILVLNTLAQKRAHIKNDPRLFSSVRNMQMQLDAAPKISNTCVPLFTGSTQRTGGDVVYYLDPIVHIPFPKVVYGSAVETVYTLAPYTRFDNLIIPHAIVKPDITIKNKDQRNEAIFRNDIMAAQQTRNNINRPLFL